MHRPILFAAIVVVGVLSACGGAPPLPPVVPGVHLWEVADHTTEGDVLVPGEASANYAAVGDTAQWPQIFSDVARVVDQGLDAATGEEKVLLVTTEGQNNNLRFHNDPAHHVVRFHDTGGSAEVWAEIVFEAAPHGRTRVHARLHADVHGIVSLFVTDNKLRTQREKKVASDLANIQRFFERRAAAGGRR